MAACALDWSCQKSGAFIFSSREARWDWALGTSKIAPHQLDAFRELGVALLQIFDVLVYRHAISLSD